LKNFIFLLFLTLSLFASEIYSDYRLEIYEKSSNLIKKLKDIENIHALKTFLKGGYVNIENVKKDLLKVIKINKEKKFLLDKEIENLKNIIKKLQIYKNEPAA